MKKSLIALAGLAASGAAMAQSSVTLYGIVDLNLASEKTATTAAGVTTGVRQALVKSGNVNTSRWGLRGTEDLGGGLTANFKFEQGFNADDGTAKAVPGFAATTPATPAAFARQAWVGLAGGFGETRLGLTTTAFDDISGTSNAVWDSLLSPMNSVFKSTGYTARPGNTFYYATPNFSGLTAAVSYSLGENKTATVGAGSVSSAFVAYANGPVAAHLGYQTEKTTGAVIAKKFLRLGASYDLGVAKLLGTYGKAENMANVNNSDATDYQLGVDVPVGAALTLSGSYAQSKNNATAGNEKRKGFGLGVKYALSKRSNIYAGFEADNAKTGAGVTTKKHDIALVGINHKF
jgi:predicted porin